MINRILVDREELIEYRKKITLNDETLIQFQCNYPGLEKNNDITVELKNIFLEEFKFFFFRNSKIILLKELSNALGPLVFFRTKKNPYNVKKELINFEKNHDISKYWDIDVFFDSKKISRYELGHEPRKCFICNYSAKYCGMKRSHTLNELINKITEDIKKHRLR